MTDIAAIVVLILLCLTGVVITVVRLPGTFLILLAAIGYSWWHEWERITLVWLLVLGGIALLGEVVDLLASLVTTRRAGGSRQAAWGGLIGAILGMIFLTVPMPLIGTFFGAIAGCFIGAAVAEILVHNRVGHGARVGIFSAIGFAIGAATKIGLAVAMAGLTIVVAVWPRSTTLKPLADQTPAPLVNDQK